MRIFNRIVITLLLAGLFVLGVFAVLYAFEIVGYRLADLPIEGFSQRVYAYFRNIESGNLGVLDILILGGIAVLGLVLLVFELKPPSPWRVRMERGTYITRGAVRNEATTATEQNQEVLQSKVNVKAQRRPGARVDIRASVRPGEDVRHIQSEVQDGVEQHFARSGIPISNLKVQVVESDPRETKTRVK
jgi:uncharacterized alkaline shock family protein YloU